MNKQQAPQPRRPYGCPECEFYDIGRIRVFQEDVPSTCKAGNTEAFDKWWEDHGERKGDSPRLYPMPCFQKESFLEKMDSLIEKGQNLLSQLEKINKEKKQSHE